MKSELSSPVLVGERLGVRAHPAQASGIGTRLLSLVALLAVLGLIGNVFTLAYRALTDAYIAPVILSPDNDLVLAHQQKVLELDMQRSIASAQVEGIEADLVATDAAEKRLIALHLSASGSLRYTSDVNTNQLDATGQEIAHLSVQRGLLQQMSDKQKEITARAADNFKSGLVTRGEYDREMQAMHQAELALLENDRARGSAQAKMEEALLGQSSIAHRSAPMPEMLSRESQMVQVQLELLRIQAEKRTKQAQLTVLKQQIDSIVGLRKHLQSRPIFQAMEKSLYAAFVPYTQMDSVRAGADVYRCKLGFFFCRGVGKVSQIVPGEVETTDPWGSPARGQYVILELDDMSAATARVLRVRPSASGSAS